MGNLNCSNSTFDNQNEMKTEDYNRNKTYIDKTNDFKIVPIRSMIKSKTISPKKHLSSQEKNYIFLDMIKNKESKNEEKFIRHSFTPCRREKFKISSETGLSPKKEENKNLMGNLNCSNSSFDNQNEMKTEVSNRGKTYLAKTTDFQLIAMRSMFKSKTISPKKHLTLEERNYIFLDKSKELKNDEKNIRRSFTPSLREKLKISTETGTPSKKDDNKKIDIKNKKNKEKEKDNKDGEDNDVNKKSALIKKVKSSPLEVICEQIEEENKILDTTKTYKNKEKNINDKNNNSIIINNVKDNDKTQKDLILNDSNENNNDDNNNNYNQKNNIILNNSNFYSDKSNNSENNKENSIFKKDEMKLCFNHTSSSKGEEENNIIEEEDKNNNYCDNNDNDFQNDNYNNNNNINGFMDLENHKENNKNLILEKYKDLYKKRPLRNKYYKELNWKGIKLDIPLLLTKKENDILLQGEFLVLNNILEIHSFVHSKYTRYLTLAKHELNIYRSKEKYLYNKSPLFNIPLFNISKCDILNKNDINMFNNLKNLLLKFSLYMKLTTVTGMLIFDQNNNANKKYRFSNPFLKQK